MKKFLFFLAVSTIVSFGLSLYFEPSASVAASAYGTTTVTLTVDSEISITADSTTSMSPNISMSQNTSIGGATFNVKTSNSAGYTMSFKATSSPALANGSNSFADYTEASAGVPETWSVGASAYEFGFSAFGSDVATSTWGTGVSCGTGGNIPADKKYRGFQGTTPIAGVASRSTTTGQSGVDTEICFAAAQGTSVNAPSGVYNAAIVATATTQ